MVRTTIKDLITRPNTIITQSERVNNDNNIARNFLNDRFSNSINKEKDLPKSRKRKKYFDLKYLSYYLSF